MQLTEVAATAGTKTGSLRGKSAIVTGSASGIGLGIARTLAGAGVNIMFSGFGSSADNDPIRNELEKRHGINTTFSGADMSKEKDIAQMIEDARTAFGQIDILVNNAGLQHVEAIETFPGIEMERHHRG
jgi:3-hydroxybutyrate dehydrogenase